MSFYSFKLPGQILPDFFNGFFTVFQDINIRIFLDHNIPIISYHGFQDTIDVTGFSLCCSQHTVTRNHLGVRSL